MCVTVSQSVQHGSGCGTVSAPEVNQETLRVVLFFTESDETI